MGADVLRINIIAKFELWCFVSSVVLKNPHYAKPRTVGCNMALDKRVATKIKTKDNLDKTTLTRHDLKI